MTRRDGHGDEPFDEPATLPLSTPPPEPPPEPPQIDTLAFQVELARRLGVRADRDAPLANLTTMRVGGRADLLATARNGFELRGLVRFARSRGIPLFILGRGSNVVVSDRGPP